MRWSSARTLPWAAALGRGISCCNFAAFQRELAITHRLPRLRFNKQPLAIPAARVLWPGAAAVRKIMKSLKSLSLAVLALIVGGSVVAAEDFHRAHKFETFAVGQWTGADKSGVLNFSKDFGGGLGVGYNLTDHFNLNTDVVFSQVKIKEGVNVSPNTTHISGHLNVDGYLFQGPLTPLLTAGLGVDDYDGRNGVPSKAALSYKVGAGLRWDINSTLFAKAVYRIAWADIRNSERFHTVSVMLGVKF